AHLDELVGDLPAELAGPQLGERGLDADVLLPGVGERGGDLEHRLEPVRRGGDERDLRADGLVPADRASPLHARPRPLTRDLERPLAGAGADRGDRQAARVERAEGDAQALALEAEAVAAWHTHGLRSEERRG